MSNPSSAAKHEEPQPSIMMVGLNREAWLTALVEKLRLLFADAGYPLGDELFISVGWPSRRALSRKQRVIGQCWQATPDTSGKPHIFISPVLVTAAQVAETVVHELGHAVLPIAKNPHGGAFRKFMKAVGLEGKPTATHAGDELAGRLKEITDSLGEYPHAPISAVEKEKPQTTRLLKLVCPDHEDVIVRASRKVIDLAMPLCGIEECGKQLEEAA